MQLENKAGSVCIIGILRCHQATLPALNFERSYTVIDVLQQADNRSSSGSPPTSFTLLMQACFLEQHQALQSGDGRGVEQSSE